MLKGMNISVYAGTKFAELYEQIRKLMKFLMKLPLVAFFLDVSKRFMKLVLATYDVVRSQEVADKVERKVDILTEPFRGSLILLKSRTSQALLV